MFKLPLLVLLILGIQIPQKKRENEKHVAGKTKIEEAEKATEDGSLFQVGQTCNRCCVNRTVQQNHSEYRIQ